VQFKLKDPSQSRSISEVKVQALMSNLDHTCWVQLDPKMDQLEARIRKLKLKTCATLLTYQ